MNPLGINFPPDSPYFEMALRQALSFRALSFGGVVVVVGGCWPVEQM